MPFELAQMTLDHRHLFGGRRLAREPLLAATVE
jgi:hypothetical protein